MTTYTWTTPPTFLAGNIITANDLNPIFHDNMLFLYQAKFAHVYRSAAQSIPNGTLTLLTWDTETEDNYGMHDNSTNPGRLTAVVAGIHKIHCQIEFAANATGTRVVQLFKNSTQIAIATVPTVTGGSVTYVDVETMMNLAVNDYCTVQVSQTSGGALNVDAGDGISFFEMAWLGSAT